MWLRCIKNILFLKINVLYLGLMIFLGTEWWVI